ncbi:PREDICTED: E3 SUMO-protein ligase MMS21 [Nelumbo nucifera]|uniref:E3 SUMO-protein ligase MMS21 n=2 Tax=Nelumbo nucifera TaxID=4432 RepID=A0A1U8A2A3_NELNU|nr:PREDICTED: E3 SUMO-protein ligase MMS21 [Nelumbo nucifera]DAD22772.1 TPA_asm: hypothetical protein HUJ06_024235 [Nelumbo nucifera]
MASTSVSHGDPVIGRIRTATSTLSSDTEALIAEIRKSLSTMKAIAVNLEKDNQSQKVKELEEAVIELLACSDDCSHLSSAIQSVGNKYQPREEMTDFNELLEDEVRKLKANSYSVRQNNILFRQFKEAIWNVHHAGQPMPGDEQEDVVMTNTQTILLNTTCPLSGKPVIELADPVRCMDCKHIYDKKSVMHYIKSNSRGGNPQCPVAGCPKVLQAGRVVCDPLLLVEIDEARKETTAQPGVVEDFTALDEED